MVTFDGLLARLRGVQRRGEDQASAFCPGHADQKGRSLSVTRKKDGGVLVHCFTGCDFETIIRAAGIEPNGQAFAGHQSNGHDSGGRPLTLEDFSAAKALPVEFLVANGVKQEAWGLQITYRERDGSLARQQRRRKHVSAGRGSEWQKGAGSPIPYGRWRLDEAMELGELLLVEGESDALTAWAHHVPALGIPGADMVKTLTGEDLAHIERLYVVQEPDQGGETFVANVGRRLRELGWPGQAYVVRLPVKDTNELHVQAGERFADELVRAKETARRLEGPEPRLQLLSWQEMVSTASLEIDYHWPGWVPLATVALLAGAGDSLKSWLALLLATFTASGRAPLVAEETDAGRLRSGPVLYITAENSIEEEKRRCALLKAGLGLPDDLPITFVRGELLSLGEDADFTEVIAAVERIRPVAIFVDSAIAVSGLEDENKNTAVRAFMKTRILPLARVHGATVYVIVHSPKAPTNPGQRFTDEHVARGAADWRNAADVVLYLRRDPTLGKQAVVLRHAKVRIGPRHDPVWFSLEDVEKHAVRIVYGGTYADDTGQGAAAGLARGIAAAIEVLKASGDGILVGELQKQLIGPGVSKATARRAVAVVRGKKPWPHGRLNGRKQAIALEDRRGRQVFLALDVAQAEHYAVSDEDPDDA